MHCAGNFRQYYDRGIAQALFYPGEERAVDSSGGGKVALTQTQFGAPLENMGTDSRQHLVLINFGHLSSLSWWAIAYRPAGVESHHLRGE